MYLKFEYKMKSSFLKKNCKIKIHEQINLQKTYLACVIEYL